VLVYGTPGLAAGRVNRVVLLARRGKSAPPPKLRFEDLRRMHARLPVAPDRPFTLSRVASLADAVPEPFIAYDARHECTIAFEQYMVIC
jgi:hypothetical protein